MLLRAKEAPTNFTGFSSHITLGSFGLFKNTSAFSHKDAKWSVSMNYGHTDYMGFRENNGFTRNGYMLNTTHRPSDKTRISLFINHINYTAYIASSLSKTDFDNHPQKAAFTWNASRGHEKNEYTVSGLTLQHEITPNIANKTSLFYSYLDHFEPRPFNILDEFTAGYGLRTIFEGQFNFLGTKARYTFGSEWYKDEYSWSTFENLYSENQGMGSLPGNALSKNKEFRSQFNGFGSFTYSFSPRFSGELGISLNQTEYDFRDLFNQGNNNRDAQRKFDPIVLPNLNLKYSFVNGAQIFTNVSRGFSNPSLEETLTPEGIVNPEIAQEKGMNYELGTQLKLFKNKVNIELLTYRMNVTDLLISQRVGEDQYMGINAGKTRHDGVELKFDLTVKLFKKFTVSRFFNYTYNDHKFLDFVDGENDFSGNPLTGVPKHRIVTGMQIKHDKGLYAGMVYTHVGTMPLTDQNTLDSDAYNLVHAKIGYGKKLGQRFRADANFGINNFFNTHYASSVLINAVGFGGNEPRYYYPGAPRNFYGGLSLRYQL
jgi:iron complex outermembrane receptor protein